MKTLHLSIIAVLIIGMGVAYAYSSAGFPETHYPPTNDTQLQLLVMNSTEFKERTTGYNYTLAGVDYNWIPKASNYYDLGGARVTFIVWGFDNGTVKGVAFNLDPQLKIKSIFEYNADNPPSGYYTDRCEGCFLGELNSTKSIVEPKITIKTDYYNYTTVDNIIITTHISNPDSNTSLEIRVIDPHYVVRDSHIFPPSLNESYSWTISPRGPLYENSGNYTVTAKYGGEESVTHFYLTSTESDIVQKYQYQTSPLKQFKSGISANNVTCNQGLELIFKIENGYPACVKQDTVGKLVGRGWAFPVEVQSQNKSNKISADTQQQQYTNITINGLKENYTLNEPIVFSIAIEGYGTGCGDTKAIITKENDSHYKSPVWGVGSSCASNTKQNHFKFNALPVNTSINQAGNYILMASFDDFATSHHAVTEQKFSVMSYTITPITNENAFGINATVYHSHKSYPCPADAPCFNPLVYYLVISAKSQTFLLNYHICDSGSCVNENADAQILKDWGTIVRLPDLHWKDGDLVDIQVQLPVNGSLVFDKNSNYDSAHTPKFWVDLGKSKIISEY